MIAVSTNTQDLQTPPDETDVMWSFAGPALAKDVTYHYIMADDTVEATSDSNLIFSDLIVATGDPHPGGQYYPQDGDVTSRDLFFRVQSSFSDVAVPEPSTFALGLWLLGLVAWRRRTRK